MRTTAIRTSITDQALSAVGALVIGTGDTAGGTDMKRAGEAPDTQPRPARPLPKETIVSVLDRWRRVLRGARGRTGRDRRQPDLAKVREGVREALRLLHVDPESDEARRLLGEDGYALMFPARERR